MAGKIAPAGRIIVADDDYVYGYGQKPEFLTESMITEFSLYAADKNGKKLKEYNLDSLPVWDGIAASKGQLYISTMDGELLCF
jgi:hypothetical protein